jgi:hypothetical protein
MEHFDGIEGVESTSKNKWVRVKVNDEYFLLNESISDSSSDEEEEDGKPSSVQGSADFKPPAVSIDSAPPAEIAGPFSAKSVNDRVKPSTVAESTTTTVLGPFSKPVSGSGLPPRHSNPKPVSVSSAISAPSGAPITTTSRLGETKERIPFRHTGPLRGGQPSVIGSDSNSAAAFSSSSFPSSSSSSVLSTVSLRAQGASTSNSGGTGAASSSSSSYSVYASADGRQQRSGSFTKDKETPEKWRMRLWPSKALIAFCRIITRCRPPASQPGVRLGAAIPAAGGNSSSNNNNNNNTNNDNNSNKHRHGKHGKLELQAHWRTSELSKVPVRFDSSAAHSSTFFLLAVEECRESVTNQDEVEAMLGGAGGGGGGGGDNVSMRRGGGGGNYGALAATNGWVKAEVSSIVSESAFAALPRACDPRLGSVWVIAANITSPLPATATQGGGGLNKWGSGNYNNGGFGAAGKDSVDFLSGGDLVVMHSPQWSHPLLGIIQPWDPDYDIKFGINFAVNQSSFLKAQAHGYDSSGGGAGGGGGAGTAAPLPTVNILVCVDQQSHVGAEDSDIGGWASQGSILTGVNFSMAVIGKCPQEGNIVELV